MSAERDEFVMLVNAFLRRLGQRAQDMDRAGRARSDEAEIPGRGQRAVGAEMAKATAAILRALLIAVAASLSEAIDEVDEPEDILEPGDDAA